MFEDFFNLDSPLFWGIIERFVVNLIFLFLLIRGVYFRYSKKPDYVFSYFLMGIVIFFIGSMLPIVFTSAMSQLGMAIGLFAIFTILRLRTRNLSIKDMAYIFTVIAISAVNSLEWSNFPVLGIFIFNILIILSAWVLEHYFGNNPPVLEIEEEQLNTHPIFYNKLELLKPQHHEELTKDVIEMTGLEVRKIEIKQVDYQNKIAVLDIFYPQISLGETQGS